MRKFWAVMLSWAVFLGLLCACTPLEQAGQAPTLPLPKETEEALEAERRGLSLCNNNLPWGGHIVAGEMCFPSTGWIARGEGGTLRQLFGAFRG